MVVAIMQPYFFPYIGYFQLMEHVDLFLLYDDVQYIKNGWVNRNRILHGTRPSWWTFPVGRSGHQELICNKVYCNRARNISKLLKQLRGSYQKAPRFEEIFELTKTCFESGPEAVGEFNAVSLKKIARKIGIQTELRKTSALGLGLHLKGQDRILELCRRVGASEYVNPAGGRALYDDRSFQDAGISLKFLESQAEPYQQFGESHVPNLSIVDVLMFNHPRSVRNMLGQYRVVR